MCVPSEVVISFSLSLRPKNLPSSLADLSSIFSSIFCGGTTHALTLSILFLFCRPEARGGDSLEDNQVGGMELLPNILVTKVQSSAGSMVFKRIV